MASALFCGDLDMVVLRPTTLSAPTSSSAISNEDMGSEEHQEQGNDVAMTDDFKLLLELTSKAEKVGLQNIFHMF